MDAGVAARYERAAVASGSRHGGCAQSSAGTTLMLNRSVIFINVNSLIRAPAEPHSRTEVVSDDRLN